MDVHLRDDLHSDRHRGFQAVDQFPFDFGVSLGNTSAPSVIRPTTAVMTNSLV
jgi:hypothetical protein